MVSFRKSIENNLLSPSKAIKEGSKFQTEIAAYIAAKKLVSSFEGTYFDGEVFATCFSTSKDAAAIVKAVASVYGKEIRGVNVVKVITSICNNKKKSEGLKNLL